ncbi:hypothetical protein L5M36_03370 [Shewanella sp. SM72]|uniref:hypothetical protein n=1 Tax=Shewanella sp. SM72 TaxID=2912805 RepID=UPI0021D9E2BA|nr:hypothetical protein [Shewanella sp. SM72]MCU8015939.1 hypothetical protein [Shewanella sp. SM72]
MEEVFSALGNWLSSFNATEYLTFSLVVITGLYAFFTYKILKANQSSVSAIQEQMEASSRPYVTVRISMQVGEPFFYLNIENVGKTAAKNLILSIDKDFFQYGENKLERNIKEFPVFKNVVLEFPTGTHLFYPLISSVDILSDSADVELVPREFRVTAEYAYLNNKVVREVFHFDLSVYQNCIALKDPIVTAINGVKAAVEKRGV